MRGKRRHEMSCFPIGNMIIASQDLHVNTGSILHLSLYNPAQAKPHKSHDRAPGAYSQTHRQAASPNER